MGATVWYASYGSNMWWDRFRCYLEGGVPPGATRRHAGARDPSPPTDVRTVRLPYRMYFAGHAASWGGGGVSFLDHERLADDDPDRAWGRAWRITRNQFDDVVAQENGLAPGEVHLDLSRVAGGESRSVTHGWYGRLVVSDMLDGCPLVTFTSLRPMSDATVNAPSAPYVRTLVEGLTECTDLGTDAIGDYLAAAPGAAS